MNETKMTYRKMGVSGLELSEFALGGWTTFGGSLKDEELAREIITTAFDAGVNFFDIADVYALGEAERLMGKTLGDLPRHELVISSKAYWPMSPAPNNHGLSRKHLFESVEASLQRIGTDYLDLYFCHRYDETTPLEETVRAMDDLVRQGKVLYWGTSEWTAAQIREAHAIAERLSAYAPRVEQPQYSLLARAKVEEDVRPATDETGMGLVLWSPLASGLLTGKYDDGIPDGSRLARIEFLRKRLIQDDLIARVREMKAIADDLGCSRTQLALAWTAAQPGVSSVILGATSVAQLVENLGAKDVEVTDEVATRLDALFPPGGTLDG
jgi:voltage-dependent potassium channel beta subunit